MPTYSTMTTWASGGASAQAFEREMDSSCFPNTQDLQEKTQNERCSLFPQNAAMMVINCLRLQIGRDMKCHTLGCSADLLAH